MRILVTNDDGIYAPGLRAAESIARQLSDDVWIVAPQDEHSGASRSLSLSNPIRLREMDEKRFAVRGTPADCVIMATCHIMPQMPDIIISGVNSGQNIADDITYSGTVAAAMEGAVLDIPSFALSQCYGIEHMDGIPWRVARAHGASVIGAILKAGGGGGCRLFNINFPDCAPEDVRGLAVTEQGKRDVNQLIVERRTDLRRRPYYWLGFCREAGAPPEGTDLHAIENRLISVTPLHLNLTRRKSLAALRGQLDGTLRA
jgi:5'-nucleotidase